MSRPTDAVLVDEPMLRGWPLPPPGGSKDARGRVVLIGGSVRSPGAVMLAGLAALRVGAGRLMLVTPAEIALPVAIAVPEAGVLALPVDADPLGEAVRSELAAADAVLLGPGLDDPEAARRLLTAVVGADEPRAAVVLDAFALGVLPGLGSDLPSEVVLSPNLEEAAILLDVDVEDVRADLPAALAAIAGRYRAVATSFGRIAAPHVAERTAEAWQVDAGGDGLGTAGSGDVLAGAIAGLLARGADKAQAAVWGTFLHIRAGDRLAERVAEVGYLARDLCDELPHVLAATGRRDA